MESDEKLQAGLERKHQECNAGDDLHEELLPPDHPLHGKIPKLQDHPHRERIRKLKEERLPFQRLAVTRRVGSPLATWVPGIPNFTPNRAGHDMWTEPRFFVFHTMVGSEPSARASFSDPNRQASSTYAIDYEGRTFQYVDERDAPWTNSTMYDEPGANLDSITCEHADNGFYDSPRPPVLLRASALLLRDVAGFYGFPLDRGHVNPPSHELKHRECAHASTSCPDTLEVDLIIAYARGDLPLPGDAMTDQEVRAHIYDWYVIYGGHWPGPDDVKAIEDHWLPLWKQDPIACRADFGNAIGGGEGTWPVRHLEVGTLQGPKGDKGDPGTSVTDDHIATVAAAEIERRLENDG